MKQWLAFAEQTIEDGLYFSSANGKDWGLGDWLAPKGVDVKNRESIDLVCNGATAVWESWNGERSRLHNCYNGIGSWFYQALGGIIPTQPGYRRVSICPQTPEGITWTEVTEETPYGTLQVRWERKNDKKTMQVTIPVGITADIFGKEYGNGSYTIEF